MGNQLEIVYGTHSVRAVLVKRPHDVKRIFILQGKGGKTERQTKWTKYYVELTKPTNIEPEVLPWHEFLRETGLQSNDNHQGICMFVKPRAIYDESDLNILAKGRLVLLLDQITNPQNLGTILRSSAFFGVDAVVVLSNRSADITPVVVRVASGGAEFVHLFRITNLARTIKVLKDLGYWVYGLDERGATTTRDTEFHKQSVLVIGAEGEGLRRLTKENCDYLVRIPGGCEGIESLNAAVAASVALSAVSCEKPSPSGS